MTIIKLGDKFFKIDNFSLVETDSPAEGVETFDGDAIAEQISKPKELADAHKQVDELKTAYTTLQEKAKESGSTEDHQKRLEAIAPFVVARHQYLERKAIQETDNGEVPEVPEPSEPSEDEGDTKTDDGDTGDKTTEAPTPETGDAPAEEEKKDDGEDAAAEAPQKELVTAAAITKFLSDQLGNQRPLTADDVFTPGEARRIGDVPRKEAQFVTAAGFGHTDMGQVLEGRKADEFLAQVKTQTLRGSGGGAQISRRVDYGSYQTHTGPVLDKDFTLDRLGERQGHAVTAAGELCDGDDRRVLPDCHDLSGDLTGLVETYPAPHCKLRYRKDLSLAAVKDGVQVYDETQKEAYCAARDAYKAALKKGDAAGASAAFFDMKLNEKQCIDTSCLEWSDFVTMLPIYRCIEWSIEQQQCSPEDVARHRRLLDKVWRRALNAHFLANLAAHTVTVNVDACADPFVNAAGQKLDAACVVDYVLSTLKPQGLMAERLTGGNYTAIIPEGLATAMGMGRRLACNVTNDVKSLTGVARVVTALDVAATAEDLCPTGPYPDLPDVGAEVDFADLLLPTDWNILFVDLDDYFQIRRPDVSIGAEITHDSIKGNWVAAEFEETFVGYGKDGCHPAWSVNFLNLSYNGVRWGCAEPPVGPC